MSFSYPNVSITPVPGKGITEVGMFNISVTPAKTSDTLLNLQFVTSIGGQPQGDFSSFVFIGSLPQGASLPQSIFYASCNAVRANQSGRELTVQVVGGVNDVGNVFDVSQGFTAVLWPGASCSMIG